MNHAMDFHLFAFRMAVAVATLSLPSGCTTEAPAHEVVNQRIATSPTSLAMPGSALVTPSLAPQVLIPFYVYPTGSTGQCDTSSYAALLASKLIRHSLVIINPSNGPVDRGSDEFVRFSACAKKIRAAGGRTLGYVSSKLTNNPSPNVFIQTGLRPMDRIVSDLRRWHDFGVDGIFVDEVTGVADPTFGDHSTHYAHYRDIYQHILSEDSSWSIWLNPGAALRPGYLMGASRVGDGAVVFERAASLWDTSCGPWLEGPWCPYKSEWDGHQPLLKSIERKEIAPKQLAVMLYGSRPEDVGKIVRKARERGIGLVYVTDDKGPGQWNRSPSPALYSALEVALGI